jgi:hypothetical protein
MPCSELAIARFALYVPLIAWDRHGVNLFLAGSWASCWGMGQALMEGCRRVLRRLGRAWMGTS